MSKRVLWIIWLLSSLLLAGALGYELFAQPQKPHFLPGQTSVGHFQIELSCGACHSESFSDRDTIQQSCVDCHGAELRLARDTHPKSKFTDPRNANRLSEIDARYCVACHSEHTPEVTLPMGLTLPSDFCLTCHQDIAEDRPSHAGMAFDTCASSGCHNYHDNLALYEDFLIEHAGEPPLKPDGGLPRSSLSELIAMSGQAWLVFKPERTPQVAESAWQEAHQDWAGSAHGQANVGCRNCHQPDTDQAWAERPDTAICGNCHQQEQDGFRSGRHGMRLAQGLPAMKPAQARQPMKPNATHQSLTCNSCHTPHQQDTRVAAVEACVGCHDDEHTLAYEGSPHHTTWTEFLAGDRPRETAVSCATCHMPRLDSDRFGQPVVVVEHNQNATLRPNEKMIRTSCMNCHGLAFSIDALASPELIRTNFHGEPETHIPSIDMALDRIFTGSNPDPENQDGERP